MFERSGLLVRIPSKPTDCYADTGSIYSANFDYEKLKRLLQSFKLNGQVKIDRRDENGEPTCVSFVKFSRFPDVVKTAIEDNTTLESGESMHDIEHEKT
jgi:hypothetical protein